MIMTKPLIVPPALILFGLLSVVGNQLPILRTVANFPSSTVTPIFEPQTDLQWTLPRA